MKLSVVTTLYKSAPFISEFHNRISLATSALYSDSDVEMIYVDDGSPDNSLDVILSIANKDPRIIVIQLSRNFGHHRAIMAGLNHACGDEVFLIDSDLEENPEYINDFKKYMDCSGSDVIYGVQSRRSGNITKRVTGNFFYYAFNLLSDSVKIPNNFCTIRLMKGYYVKELLKFSEKDFYFAPLTVLAGFKQLSFHIDKSSKLGTTYSFFSRLHLFISSIFSYTTKPLFFIFYFGFFITLISFFILAIILIRKIFFGINADGWTSLILSLWFFGGAVIFFIGICSIYISKIITEVKGRPSFIVKNIFRKNFS